MNPIRVMLVDDNRADRELTVDTLQAGKIALDITTAIDGEDALAKLEKTATGDLPDLILLDLNMPRMDGREFLSAAKRDERVRHIPVVVLTSSDAERDIVSSYELGASCFVSKPVGLKELREVVRSIESFWFTIVRLP